METKTGALKKLNANGELKVGTVVRSVVPAHCGYAFTAGRDYTIKSYDQRTLSIVCDDGAYVPVDSVTLSTFSIVDPGGESCLIESDGGATSYYELPAHATELRHLISAKGMSKARGDIFKACYRLGEKAGTDVMYDLRKMEFFIKDMIEMAGRGEHL